MRSIVLLREHAGLAGIAALVFLAGAASALIVHRYRLDFLAWLPLRILARVSKLFSRYPNAWFIFAFIFLFNGTAMFLYMLSGVVTVLPAAIAFLTGMNIGVVAIKGAAAFPGGGDSPEDLESLPEPRGKSSAPLVLVCFLIVLCLELPCFWFSIALGSTMSSPGIPNLWPGSVLPRITAYLTVILPLLAVSAMAEAIALKHTLCAPKSESPEQ